MAELFTVCSTIQRSIKACRVFMHQAVTQEDQLVLLPPASTSTFVLASFRMLPAFYRMLETKTKEQMAEVPVCIRQFSCPPPPPQGCLAVHSTCLLSATCSGP